MQVYTSLQTDNHASTPPLSFLQAGCPSCCPTNSVKAMKANMLYIDYCGIFDDKMLHIILYTVVDNDTYTYNYTLYCMR